MERFFLFSILESCFRRDAVMGYGTQFKKDLDFSSYTFWRPKSIKNVTLEQYPFNFL